MARNKHPEETVKLILDVAAQLFMEKGYDRTSLQDIIHGTGLSKGAIYHHFASKEEIFVQICERIGRENEEYLGCIRDNRQLNGLAKLKKIFRAALLSGYQEQVVSMVPYLLDNPRFLTIIIKGIYEDVVPRFMGPILMEGIGDGSIRTEHPQELAEALMTLANVWLHPLLQPTTVEQVRARCAVYNRMTGVFGVELLDEELVRTLCSYNLRLQELRAGTQGAGSETKE